MARKRKKKNVNPPTHFANVDATIKQLQTQLTDPRVWTWMYSGARGIRERLVRINFETLRQLVERVPIIAGIINTRCDQILPYTKYATEENDKGFRFELERSTERTGNEQLDETEVIQLADFFEQTGFVFDDEREDDFSDYCLQAVREILTIDQIATEIQKNRMGEAIAFWILDGATIKRVGDESEFARGVRFVQEIDLEIYNKYTSEDMVFDYMYKRADIRYRGYGYSPVEQAVDIITTLLFGYQYMRDQMVRDRVPKGFISVMGDVGKPQMDAIRQYWYYAMSGAGGVWNIPILPSGKDGVGVDFKNIGNSNRDMEYHKLMMFISSICAAVFSIDLAEMGIKTDDSTALIGESAEPRIAASKDRGLMSILSFLQQHTNKILRKVTQKYRFKFVGMVEDDEEKKAKVRSTQLSTHRTINEIREEDGLEAIKEDYADVVLNPQAVQIYMGGKQAEMGGAMGGGEGQPFGEEEEEGEEERGVLPFGRKRIAVRKPQEEEEEGEEVEKSLQDFRSLTRAKEKTVKFLIE